MILTRSRPQGAAKLTFSIDDYYGLEVAEILSLLPVMEDIGLPESRQPFEGGGVAKGDGYPAANP
jgi:hypothetical protein